MGLWDNPKQGRDSHGKFLKKTSPPKPSKRIKRARIAAVRHLPTYVFPSPQGFLGEPRYLKAPPRPMGVKEKKAWFAEQQAKGEKRVKLRKSIAKRRSRNAKKILGKAWHRIW